LVPKVTPTNSKKACSLWNKF